jgi:hypothetical protein
MPAEQLDQVSGHSVRVGAAQDLFALSVAPAKSTRMPLQYAQKINAARSGMARAVKAEL